MSGIPELIEAIKLQDSGPTEASRAIRKKLYALLFILLSLSPTSQVCNFALYSLELFAYTWLVNTGMCIVNFAPLQSVYKFPFSDVYLTISTDPWCPHW